jgi:hypothetical protein
MKAIMALGARMPMKISKKGDLVTSPVFLDFTQGLFKPREPSKEQVERATKNGEEPKKKYDVTTLFLPNADFSLMRSMEDAIYEEKGILRKKVNGKPVGPWIDQKDSLLAQEDIGIDKKTGDLKKGYVEGAKALRLSSYIRPLVSKMDVVTNQYVPIDAPAYDVVYSGVLAICTINPYYAPTSAKLLADKTVKRGVFWGIKSVVIINSNTEKWFEGNSRPATIEDLDEIGISADDIIEFDDPDGNVEHQPFSADEELVE